MYISRVAFERGLLRWTEPEMTQDRNLEWLPWFSAGWSHPRPLVLRLEEPLVRSGGTVGTAGVSMPVLGASPTTCEEASVGVASASVHQPLSAGVST